VNQGPVILSALKVITRVARVYLRLVEREGVGSVAVTRAR
jgi:hypothetical protein